MNIKPQLSKLKSSIGCNNTIKLFNWLYYRKANEMDSLVIFKLQAGVEKGDSYASKKV